MTAARVGFALCYHAFMGLMECKECGGQVSAKAKACPHCGFERWRWLSSWRLLFLAAVAVFAASYYARDSYLAFAASRVEVTKGSVDSVIPFLKVNVIVENRNWHAVKDLTLVCRYLDANEAEVGRNDTVLRAEIPAGSSKEFKEVGFGVDFNIDIFELDADILPRRLWEGKFTVCDIESIAI